MKKSLMVVVLLASCVNPIEDIASDPPEPRKVEDHEVASTPVLVPEESPAPVQLTSERRVGSTSVPARIRRVRRWRWGSPSEAREALWNIPEDASVEAVVNGLLRICVSEAGFEGAEDCIGIWQVVGNVRSRTCDRQRIRRITECDGNGETVLSAMRRLSKTTMGVVAPRTRRQRWIAGITPECEKPNGFPSDVDWENYRGKCEDLVALVRDLVTGTEQRRLTRAPIIAWGGRCEVEGGACDDAIACSRGLARVPDTDTANAFWCRPGSKGCSSSIDPMCSAYRNSGVELASSL